MRLFAGGDPTEALRLALLECGNSPDSAAAHALAAAASHALGRPEDALAWFRMAITLDPADPEAGCGLAACQFDLKLWRAARATLEAVLRKHADHVRAWCNLALACEADGDRIASADALERAARLAPDDDAVLRIRAACALRAGQALTALALARAALGAHEDEVLGRHLIINCALAARRPAEAIDAARRLLAANDDDASARLGLATGLAMQGELRQASVEVERVPPPMRTGFDARLVYLVAGIDALRACDWRQSGSWNEVASALATDPALTFDAAELPFAAIALGTAPAVCKDLFAAHVRHLDATERALAWPRAPRGKRTKLRIGYLGTGFGEHPSGMALNPILQAHDRARFEVYCYALSGDDGSAWRAEAVAAADVFRVVHHMSATECAGRIAVDDIDVLVDFSGLLVDGRPAVHRHHTARAHMLLFETPALLSLPGIDATIGDAVVLDAAEPGERLPHCLLPLDPRWTRIALEGEAPRRADHGLPEDVPVLCCFNTSYKIEPMVFGAWMRIMKRCPDALLWLRDGGDAVQDNLRREAGAGGVAPERLIFAGRLPFAEHLRRQRLADMFLDTFHYGAHVTGLQALAAGLPLLTVYGDRFSARVGASALIHAGLGDLVAANLDDYVERALQFCRRSAVAADWRRRTQAAFALANTEARFTAYVRALEDLYSRSFEQASGHA